MAPKSFSIVIPTHTGLDHIGSCLRSIFCQDISRESLEVIVVIDGKNPQLEAVVRDSEKESNIRQFPFKVFSFEKNRGRFEARYKGAELATNQQLLFIDDRTILDDKFIPQLLRTVKDETFIANVVELEHPNAVSRSLYLLRKKIYKNWGENFKPYYITEKNFDTKPKGTAGLWVKRSLFLDACEIFKAGTKDTANASDDTKLLKLIVAEEDILRTSSPKLFYEPRKSIIGELKHLYYRGPLFVDYYLKLGSPYFLPLIFSYSTGLVFLLSLVIAPVLVIYAAALTLFLSVMVGVFVAQQAKDIPLVAVFLPLVGGVFYSGLIRGLWKKYEK